MKLLTLTFLSLFVWNEACHAAIIRSKDPDDPSYIVVTPLNEDWVRFDHCLTPNQACKTLGTYHFSGLKDRRQHLKIVGYSLYGAQIAILAVGLVAGLGLISGTWAPAGLAATIFNALTGTGAVIVSKIIFFFTGAGMAVSSSLFGGLVVALGSYYASSVQVIDGGRRLTMANTISQEYLKSGESVIEVQMPIVTFVKSLREALSKVDNRPEKSQAIDVSPLLPLYDELWMGYP